MPLRIGTYSGGVGLGALISMRLPTMTVETTRAANTKLSRGQGLAQQGAGRKQGTKGLKQLNLAYTRNAANA
jgi:hypothetical protein